MSAEKLLPSEHYLDAARRIVRFCCPDLLVSSKEFHEKLMFTWRVILEAVLDEPKKTS